MVVVGAAAGVGEWGVLVPAALGVAITLPPSVATLVGVVKVAAVKPDVVPIAALAATFLRMIWAIGVVALLQSRAVGFDTTAEAIAGWTTASYLFTLFVETALLWRMLARPGGVTDGATRPAVGSEDGRRR